MTAKEYLNDIRKLDNEIQTLKEQIDRLRQDAEGVRAMELTDMPKGGKTRDMGDAVADVVDLQMLCAEYISDLVRRKSDAMACISKIEGSELRNVLFLRYMQCLEWDEIIDRLHYSRRTVFHLHGEALQEFSKLCTKLH